MIAQILNCFAFCVHVSTVVVSYVK
jgi:hypothetical protein